MSRPRDIYDLDDDDLVDRVTDLALQPLLRQRLGAARQAVAELEKARAAMDDLRRAHAETEHDLERAEARIEALEEELEDVGSRGLLLLHEALRRHGYVVGPLRTQLSTYEHALLEALGEVAYPGAMRR